MLRIKTLRYRPIAWKRAYLFLCAFFLMDLQAVIFAGAYQPVTYSGTMTNDAVSNETARVLLLTENINSAIAVYAQLLSKDSTNAVLSSEYAYALALDGIYDAAMVRLDKIWSGKADNKEVNYFTSQVFALMGYDQLAGEFLKESEKNYTPAWISSKAPELMQKHKRILTKPTALNRDELVTMFKQANRLTAQNFTLQSVSMFEEIVNQYPGEYLPYVGYSIALEKAGLLEKSAQTIEAALHIIGDNPEQKDTKQFLDQRLLMIKNKISLQPQNSGSTVSQSPASGDKGPQMLAYAGGLISSTYSSLNIRGGQFITKSTYTTIDFGLTSSSSKVYTNVGFSVYNRERVFVEGFGLTGTFSNGTTALYAKISVGLSFMNKNRTSSLDIFLDGRMPITKGGVTTVGLSIGQSIYFGKRK
jgi:tetratricopeptide (TPR) repeat protein